MRYNIKEIEAKSVLQKSKLPESEYCINPYVGCLHGCVYCYARFMRRFTGHANENWGEFLDVKVNAPAVLEKQLRNLIKFTIRTFPVISYFYKFGISFFSDKFR